jgi:putative inorganic carbon (hco3(-)) transporter
MRDLILTAIVFGSVPFMVLRPSFGVLIWSWLGYMNPHRATYGFAYNFPFVQVAALSTILGLIFSKEKVRFPWNGTTFLWMLWTAWFCVTTVFALNGADALEGWSREIKVQAMVFVTLLVMHSKEKLERLVWVIVISIGLFGVKGGIFTAVHGGNYIVWGPPSSFIEGNNELALALLTVVPLMRYLQTRSSSKWIRRGLAAAMVLCAFSIVGSYSRGALLGATAMAGLLWLKSKRKIAFGIPIFAVFVLAVMFMPDRWGERMGTIQTYDQDASALGRINAWNFAFNLAKDHPVTGGGFNVFTHEMFARYAPNPQDVHDAHSIYFQVLGEHGFVGLFVFVMLGIATVTTASWIIRKTRAHPDLQWAHDLASMIQVSFAGFAVGGAFLGLAYWDLPYHLMAIAVLTRVIVREALDAAPAPAEGPRLAALPRPADGGAPAYPPPSMPGPGNRLTGASRRLPSN